MGEWLNTDSCSCSFTLPAPVSWPYAAAARGEIAPIHFFHPCKYSWRRSKNYIAGMAPSCHRMQALLALAPYWLHCQEGSYGRDAIYPQFYEGADVTDDLLVGGWLRRRRSLELHGSTLRSLYHEICIHSRTVSPRLKDNYPSKCSSENIPDTKYMSPYMENCQKYIAMYCCFLRLRGEGHEK